ncbi:type II toxin-antitoxin system VapC family toxin [Streptomyces sp. NPDC059761]|uniref:type II toxin-antitoxin system VapC family toxin n=1 Tax=unclassified Streptomyces TaxID=2593676 RepID=UPI00365D3984
MTPRTAPAMLGTPRTLVLDSEALSKAARGDHEVRGMIRRAPNHNMRVVTSSLTTLEAWDPRAGVRQEAWAWFLSNVDIVHTSDEIIETARSLLKEAGLHGHKYAIDAVLAATAVVESRRGGFVNVLTSDLEDMKRLIGGRRIRIEPV